MNQLVIITHAVFIGLTPLIPVPILDDVVKSIFYRRLIRDLASNYDLTLSGDEVDVLAEDCGSGCLQGCLFGLVEYFVKRLIQKLSFVLEWRRSVELVTHTYYVGYLMDYTFQRGWYVPGDVVQAAQLRAAIEQACNNTNTELVKHTVQSSFDKSSKLVKSTVRQMADSLQKITFRRSRAWLRRTMAVRRPRRRLSSAERAQVAQVEDAVSQALEQEVPHTQASLASLITQLQNRLAELPKEHFEALQRQLERALGQTGD